MTKKIFGIDPGSRFAGYACIAAKRNVVYSPKDFSIVDVGVLQADSKISLLNRLGDLHEGMFQVLEDLQPHLCVIETAFVGPNVQSALKLGQARGALTSAASRLKIPIIELSPTYVKKIVVGKGRASKEEVADSLSSHLGFKRGLLPYDASDALAIALSGGLAQIGHPL